MKFFYYFYLLIGFCTCQKLVNGIYQLTYDTFDDFISEYKSVFVKFYSPNCVHCNSLKPEFQQLVDLLKNEDIVLAEVDCSVETKLAEEQDIDSYPIMKLYLQNAHIEYKQVSNKAVDLSTWVKKKLSPQIQPLLTVKDVDEAISQNKVAAIYFGNPYGQEFHLLSAIALQFDEIYFGHTQDSRAFRKYYISTDKEYSLVVFKQFDDKRADYQGPWDFGKEIAEFLYDEQFPLVLEFSPSSAEKIFTENKPYLFLLLGKGTEGLQHLELFQSLAKRFKNKGIGSCVSKIGGQLNDRLLEFLGINEGIDTFPIIIYLQPNGADEPTKYRMKEEINSENLKHFIKSIQKGNSKEQIRRGESTDTNDQSLVQKVVRQNWKDIVLNKQKDVLLLIVTEWCEECKQIEEEFQRTALMFQNDKQLEFGILSYEKNEIEGLKIEKFPLIKFYPKADKSGIFNVAGKYDANSIAKFIKTHHTVKSQNSDEL